MLLQNKNRIILLRTRNLIYNTKVRLVNYALDYNIVRSVHVLWSYGEHVKHFEIKTWKIHAYCNARLSFIILLQTFTC